jgi:hypothetical protein
MEALAALSVAGNVVQFIQFASEVVTETRETYRSADDASAQHLDLEAVAEDLQKVVSPLQASRQVSIGPVGDLAFGKLLVSCIEAAEELHSAIQELKVKDGPHRKWRSFGKALISVWKREKISSFQKRVSLLRDQIQFHIVDDLRYFLNPSKSKAPTYPPAETHGIQQTTEPSLQEFETPTRRAHIDER